MCFGTEGVNSLDLTRSILSGTPRRQITPGQIKSRVSTAADRGKKKKPEKLLRKPITEGRDGEGAGEGERIRSKGSGASPRTHYHHSTKGQIYSVAFLWHKAD